MRKGYLQQWTLGNIELRIEYLPSGLTKYFVNDAEVDFIDVKCDYGEYPHQYNITIIPGMNRSQMDFPTGYKQISLE